MSNKVRVTSIGAPQLSDADAKPSGTTSQPKTLYKGRKRGRGAKRETEKERDLAAPP